MALAAQHKAGGLLGTSSSSSRITASSGSAASGVTAVLPSPDGVNKKLMRKAERMELKAAKYREAAATTTGVNISSSSGAGSSAGRYIEADVEPTAAKNFLVSKSTKTSKKTGKQVKRVRDKLLPFQELIMKKINIESAEP